MSATSPEVSGTVESHSRPIAAALVHLPIAERRAALPAPGVA